MIAHMFEETGKHRRERGEFAAIDLEARVRLAIDLTLIEEEKEVHSQRTSSGNPQYWALLAGAGKSSLTDELLWRFARNLPDFQIAVVSVDPSRRRTGGALSGTVFA